LAALLARWDDGLAAGPGLLALAYTVSLTNGMQSPLDRGAPLVAVGLVAIVEFGAWSLELRDGGERSLFGRLPQLGLGFVVALASSALVLAVGSIRSGAGIALFVLGAAAAAGLVALIAHPVWATFRRGESERDEAGRAEGCRRADRRAVCGQEMCLLSPL